MTSRLLKQQPVLEPALVASEVHRWMQHDSRCQAYDLSSFGCSGSYPAFAHAHRCQFADLDKMRYNDIDVLVQVRGGDRFASHKKMIDVWSDHILIGGFKVEINFVVHENLNFTKSIDSADINIVRVGFWVLNGKISRWDIREEFYEFLATKTLALVNFERLKIPAGSLVRLLAKHQQMGFAYTLPPDEVLLTTLHNGAIGMKNKQKYDLLVGSVQQVIWSRFTLLQSQDKKGNPVFIFTARREHQFPVSRPFPSTGSPPTLLDLYELAQGPRLPVPHTPANIFLGRSHNREIDQYETQSAEASTWRLTSTAHESSSPELDLYEMHTGPSRGQAVVSAPQAQPHLPRSFYWYKGSQVWF